MLVRFISGCLYRDGFRFGNVRGSPVAVFEIFCQGSPVEMGALSSHHTPAIFSPYPPHKIIWKCHSDSRNFMA